LRAGNDTEDMVDGDSWSHCAGSDRGGHRVGHVMEAVGEIEGQSRQHDNGDQ
jgi:hypothetical protein